MKVIESMDREEFNKVTAAGAAALNGLEEAFAAQGIDRGHLGNALLVALAAVMKNGDVTPQEILQGIENCSKLWVADEEGNFFLRRLPVAPKDPSKEN